MVKETEKNNKKVYECEACNFFYESNELAEKCEQWCTKHKSCNMDITKHAIK